MPAMGVYWVLFPPQPAAAAAWNWSEYLVFVSGSFPGVWVLAASLLCRRSLMLALSCLYLPLLGEGVGKKMRQRKLPITREIELSCCFYEQN